MDDAAIATLKKNGTYVKLGLTPLAAIPPGTWRSWST